MHQEHNEGKLDHSKYIYEQINNWIENADNKVSISCAIFTGVFGVITFLSQRITVSEKVNECLSKIHGWCFSISVVLMLISILLYVLAINPNLGKSGKKKKGIIPRKKYPVFYGDIASMNISEYKRTINRATEEDLIDELQNEAHYNSRICLNKMCRYRIGLWFSFSAIVFALLSWALRSLMFC